MHPLGLSRPFPAIISTYMGRSGQRAYFIFFEPCFRSDRRIIDNIAFPVLSFLSNARLRTLKSTQVNTHLCNLCRCHRTTARSLDTNTTVPYTFLFLSFARLSVS